MKSFIASGLRKFYNLLGTPAVILLYHRVTTLKSDPQQLSVSPDNFNDQIAHLKSEYNLLELDEFLSLRQRKRTMPKRSVIVTFDDGYADNYHEVLPILETHKAQALFYISTGLLDSKIEFWWDDLERIFLLDHPLPKTLTIQTDTTENVFDTQDTSHRQKTYHALHPLIKQMDIPGRNAMLSQIVEWSGLGSEGRDSHRVMTVRELEALAKSKAAVIGAHTHSHPRLINSSREVQKNEIATSKKILEGLLNYKILHFSYPFGTKLDFNADSIDVCNELEFEMACANFPGQVHTWHSNLALPRMIVRNWPVDQFAAKMEKFYCS